MECVIFCGGFGTRMNNGIPGGLKPLMEVGGMEILRHIISIYENNGITDFILLGGYRIIDLKAFSEKYSEINIRVIDTGERTPTGGRLLKVKDVVSTKDKFLLTYGDSLTNYNLSKCLALKAKLHADFTISVYNKKLEYGVLKTDQANILEDILEKTHTVKINAGFYILDHRIFEYIASEEESFEIDVLPRLLNNKELRVGCYEVSFWHPMDTPEDQKKLNQILINDPKKIYKS